MSEGREETRVKGGEKGNKMKINEGMKERGKTRVVFKSVLLH